MKVQYLSDSPIPWQDFYAMAVKIDLGLKKLLAVLKKEDLSMKFEYKKSATYLLRETAVTGRVSVAVSGFIIFYHYKIVK